MVGLGKDKNIGAHIQERKRQDPDRSSYIKLEGSKPESRRNISIRKSKQVSFLDGIKI